MRQLGSPLLFCLGLALVTGCASAGSRFVGDAHGDAGYDFSKVRRIAILKHPGREGPEDARTVRMIVDRELIKQLEAKGYRVVPPAEADLHAKYYAGLQAKVRMSGGAAPEGTDARMTLQFLEPGSGYSVWYGWTKATWRESMQPVVEVPRALRFLLVRFPDAGGAKPVIPTGLESES